MVETQAPKIDEKPLIAASMFGNTTILVDRCRETLERSRLRGPGISRHRNRRQRMEGLIADGFITGVLDVTTTEWADELWAVSYRPGRAGWMRPPRLAYPQVIAPGCLDMANFWARDTVPAKYATASSTNGTLTSP